MGSIFREKLVFDGTEYRTPRLNETAVLIYQINSMLAKNKNGKERVEKRLSRLVLQEVQISKHFYSDLEILSRLQALNMLFV